MIDPSSFYTQFLTGIDGWQLLVGTDVEAGLAPEPAAKAVYVNTGLRAAIESLEANFLSVANWVGGPWFWPAATAFARAHPPQDGRLFLYGDGFPDFLASMEHAHLARYTSDLAWVDWMNMRAHAAGDHLPLTATHLAMLPAEALPALQLKVAPATHWRASPGYALVELWRSARAGRTETEVELRDAAGVLVTRPDDEVWVHEVPLASLHLLDALAAGQNLADAAAHASSRESPERPFDLQAALGALLENGALQMPPT
ncbi:putative DNA-binding domain-containing protein [Mitsuaria sp. WAJ17]|uniref:HvfC/BufC family peptide modification chaperone n=1 Tax=Mitsuaria sp. WAJ17 TaxID=2761452 RepID=UPI0015FEEDFE|nr:putative DNA-binding domain-containing protein [Mitsuaria sp. WAJ17]MBB2487529.1 putative DNA-binding domain-containing protein [Mitsuaria sp. WAJ17]